MENQRARHIGDIIRERNNRPATPAPKRDAFSQPSSTLRLVLRIMLDALAAIGWFVTLPYITHDGRALTAREQSRG